MSHARCVCYAALGLFRVYQIYVLFLASDGVPSVFNPLKRKFVRASAHMLVSLLL